MLLAGLSTGCAAVRSAGPGGDPLEPPASAGVCCTGAGLRLGGARHGRCQLRPAAVRPQGQM